MMFMNGCGFEDERWLVNQVSTLLSHHTPVNIDLLIRNRNNLPDISKQNTNTWFEKKTTTQLFTH